ncbi:MAG TPA: aldehyde dehydrogenase family protein, partial [Gammaproteobacteria bacterium]|nr:aldehyde dehydrogenase family protein [Gammaproteobacteria bacterium]
MSFQVISPVDGQVLREIPAWDEATLDQALADVSAATPAWAQTPVEERARLMARAAEVLRANEERYARIMTTEMGKLFRDARAEVQKCAWVCEYYAEQGPRFLADEIIESDAGKSYVAYLPLGTVLAVMPWNFPFWQVFRFAAPALVAGNTGVLKHASNVPESALAIEEVFREAGFPDNVFRTLMIRAGQVRQVIEDPRVQAVTLTGSEPAGRQVAATAGGQIKKSVLELGGSDAFVVLEDADLDLAVQTAVTSRFLNNGQSCIAAKRFIVVDAIDEDFLNRFQAAVEALHMGDPFDEATNIGPMART